MRRGFTLIEISLVIAIISILTSFSIISLGSAQHEGYEQSSLETLISDLKLQQLKAMTGDGESTAVHEPFGLYFATNSYTLFRGSTYNPTDPTNFSIALEDALDFSPINFPGSELIFAKGGGEIMGFIDGQNTIVIKNNVTNQQITITLNRYGVINDIAYLQ